MKNISYIIVYLFCIQFCYAQEDSVFCKERYSETINDRIIRKEAKMTNFYYPQYFFKWRGHRNIKTASIPIYKLQQVNYTCCSLIDTMINYTCDTHLQIGVIYDSINFKTIGFIEIQDSQIDKWKEEDILHPESAPLHGRFIFYDKQYISNRISRIIERNSFSSVFMIKDLTGFWILDLRNKHVKKVTSFCGIIFFVNGTSYFAKHYGEDFYNDISTDGYKIGKSYKKCPSCPR